MIGIKVNVVVKTVPHPNPKKLVDLWAALTLKEILRREREEISLK